MDNEQSTNYSEYSYEKAVTGKDKMKRALYFIGIVLVMLLPVLIAMLFKVYFIMYVMPLVLILGVPLAKYFYKYFQVEYKNTVDRSTFKMELIHGKSKPRLLYEADVKDMEFAVPLTAENLGKYKDVQRDVTARCLVTDDSPDAYITLFKDKNGKKVFLYFEGSKKALKIMNYYNKNVVVSPDLSH